MRELDDQRQPTAAALRYVDMAGKRPFKHSFKRSFKRSFKHRKYLQGALPTLPTLPTLYILLYYALYALYALYVLFSAVSGIEASHVPSRAEPGEGGHKVRRLQRDEKTKR